MEWGSYVLSNSNTILISKHAGSFPRKHILKTSYFNLIFFRDFHGWEDRQETVLYKIAEFLDQTIGFSISLSVFYVVFASVLLGLAHTYGSAYIAPLTFLLASVFLSIVGQGLIEAIKVIFGFAKKSSFAIAVFWFVILISLPPRK
jgi:hypothetical protein